MKFTVELEDESPLYELMDSMFVSMLERELKSTQEFLNYDGWKHPDDVKTWKKQVKALKYLLTIYGGNYGFENN
jgi:hypothetical protein